MNVHEKLNYVEFPCSDIAAAKQFFEAVFGWEFQDFGPDYSSFSNEGLDGGFFKSNACATTGNGSALLIFYSANLEMTLEKVKGSGGSIIRETFSFPGGRRFHFIEPSGNEFGVWSEDVT
ncbi:VOC family protein [bacterium]|nr:VOC family protein [bacterium]MDA7925119.1 VOC family protein [Mariniblastus sp.]MDA7904446.1 VOC family protein [bacterium]MDB4357603.1 VOC family protein [Mariniblastus sp.]MDB4372929.1 VOC family protein [Mariniblastus sp.]